MNVKIILALHAVIVLDARLSPARLVWAVTPLLRLAVCVNITEVAYSGVKNCCASVMGLGLCYYSLLTALFLHTSPVTVTCIGLPCSGTGLSLRLCMVLVWQCSL